MQIDPWAEAIREAREHELGYVGTDLVLLGLSRTDGPAGQVLRELGATPEKLFEVIDRFGWTPANDVDELLKMYPRETPAAHHARGRAEGIAIGLGKQETQVDLLLALAYDRNGFHQAILGQLGIDSPSIVAAVARRGLPVPATPPPSRPEPPSLQLVLPLEQRDVVLKAIEKATIEDRARFFDEYGQGRWGMNAIPERPGYGFISATDGLGLREIATAALTEAGYPPPPEDAWTKLGD
jgi:Clp amino terminal domain, pathogenicity island component